MCPPKFSSALFWLTKCPFDNVNNFVEIENFCYFRKKLYVRTKFYYFPKNDDISGKILLFSEKTICPEKIMTCPKNFLSKVFGQADSVLVGQAGSLVVGQQSVSKPAT